MTSCAGRVTRRVRAVSMQTQVLHDKELTQRNQQQMKLLRGSSARQQHGDSPAYGLASCTNLAGANTACGGEGEEWTRDKTDCRSRGWPVPVVGGALRVWTAISAAPSRSTG